MCFGFSLEKKFATKMNKYWKVLILIYTSQVTASPLLIRLSMSECFLGQANRKIEVHVKLLEFKPNYQKNSITVFHKK